MQVNTMVKRGIDNHAVNKYDNWENVNKFSNDNESRKMYCRKKKAASKQVLDITGNYLMTKESQEKNVK